jgi:hypothetical protein
MIFQILFSLLLVGMALYAYLQKHKSPYFFYTLTILILMGIYLLWNPIDATRLANLIGVGRGADLLLYVWVVMSFLIIINLHHKLRQLMEFVTILSRKIVILEAEAARSTTLK